MMILLHIRRLILTAFVVAAGLFCAGVSVAVLRV